MITTRTTVPICCLPGLSCEGIEARRIGRMMCEGWRQGHRRLWPPALIHPDILDLKLGPAAARASPLAIEKPFSKEFRGGLLGRCDSLRFVGRLFGSTAGAFPGGGIMKTFLFSAVVVLSATSTLAEPHGMAGVSRGQPATGGGVSHLGSSGNRPQANTRRQTTSNSGGVASGSNCHLKPGARHSASSASVSGSASKSICLVVEMHWAFAAAWHPLPPFRSSAR